MIVIPFRVSKTHYSVYLGFDDEGLDRLKQYDPGELVLGKLGEPWTALQLKDVLVGYATEADLLECQRILQDGNDVKKALRHLSRGWQFRPDLGDHDGPPLSATNKPGERKQ